MALNYREIISSGSFIFAKTQRTLITEDVRDKWMKIATFGVPKTIISIQGRSFE